MASALSNLSLLLLWDLDDGLVIDACPLVGVLFEEIVSVGLVVCLLLFEL